MDNLDEYKSALNKHGFELDNGSLDVDPYDLVQLGKDLLEYCEFLEGKCRAKVCVTMLIKMFIPTYPCFLERKRANRGKTITRFTCSFVYNVET